MLQAIRTALPGSRVGLCALMVTAAVATISGCSTYERTAGDVTEAVEHWEGRRAVHVNSAATTASGSHHSPAGMNEVVRPRRPLDQYIQTALERNPAIKAAIADTRSKLERIPQVTSLPDPMLRAIVRPEPVQTAAGDMYFTLGVSQTLPLLAKLEKAGNIAAAEVRMSIEQLNSKRIRLIADVERAYWQVYLFDRYVEITTENRRMLTDLERVVNTLYQVGKTQQSDLLRVQTHLARLRDEEHRYGLRRAGAAAMLNQLMDSPPQSPVESTSPTDLPAINVEVDRLVELAVEHNPELAILQKRIERDREQVALADLGYWPDLTVGFEWNYLEGRDAFMPRGSTGGSSGPPVNRMSEEGDDNYAITFQVNVPIWAGRVEAGRREARQKFLMTQSDLRATRNLIAFRIFDALSKVQEQQHTLTVLDTELIPEARQTYEVVLTSYQAGETDFPTLIDDWQRWLDFELMRHRETVDLETAFADLQREVGIQLVREWAAADSGSDGGKSDD